MARPPLLVRPFAALAAGLLVTGLVQAAPASADDTTGPSISISVFPSPELSYYPGDGKSAATPANLGRMPGSVPLRANIVNTGDEALTDLTVVSGDAASTASRTDNCDWNPEGVNLPEGGPFLLAGLFGMCYGLGPSGVMDDVVNDNVTSVTARGVNSGKVVRAETHYYSIAEDDSIKLGDTVWLDQDRDGVQDAGEPGIPGVRLTVTDPQGQTPQDFFSRDKTVDAQVTDANGSYLFKHLFPIADGERYTVTIDQSSAALEGLVPTRSGVGGSETDSSTGSSQSSEWLSTPGGTDFSLDFGFVAPEPPPTTPMKATVALTSAADPDPAVKGSTITVTGTFARDGKPFAGSAVLEFRVDGSTSWTRVKDVTSRSDGILSTTVKAGASGSFRFRFGGDSTTMDGVSTPAHVDVRNPAAQLTIAAPGSAITGSTITVKGSIKRDGKAFKTSTTLERRVAGGSWSKVKTVRSSSKGALSTTVKADRSADYRFRFAGDKNTDPGASAADSVTVRKATIRLTVSAPSSVTKGKAVKVKGSVKREGKKYRAPTVLEFRADSGGGWSKVKSVRSSKKGALSASVKPSRSGEYRYRFAGNSTTDAGTSGGDHVTVKPKPPAKPKPKAYANCTALNKVYPHGVGRSGARDKGGDVTEFTRDTKTYNKNTKSDRDKDGIACEK